MVADLVARAARLSIAAPVVSDHQLARLRIDLPSRVWLVASDLDLDQLSRDAKPSKLTTLFLRERPRRRA